MILSKKEVIKLLPQKDPFRFVDTVSKYNEEKKLITTNFTFSDKLFFFKGHFPNNPIVPGVLLNENIAQTGLLLLSMLLKQRVNQGYLIQANNFKYRKPIFPNDEIVTQCFLKQKLGNYFFIKGIVSSKNEAAVSGEVVLTMGDVKDDN